MHFVQYVKENVPVTIKEKTKKQVNNEEMDLGDWLSSVSEKDFKKKDSTMGLVSVNLETNDYRFGGYVYGRWKQKFLYQTDNRNCHKCESDCKGGKYARICLYQ